jgi:hypothetical protein
MNTSSREPETISQNGEAPKSRFSTYAGLFSAYEEAKRENMVNDVRFTSIRGIYDRKPPEDPAYLRTQGMEDMPNFNLGEFTSKVDSYVSTWVDHNVGGYKFAEVKLKRIKDVPPEVSDFFDEKVTDFFNEAITEWEDDSDSRSASQYILESCIRDVQMGLFGIGLPIFRDDVDWRFTSIPTRKVFVPQGTKITLANCPVLFVDSETTVTALYKLVKNAPKDSGWNDTQVWKMLYERTAEQRQGGVVESFSEWENRSRNNDVFITSNFSPVLLVDCYVQEFTDAKKKDGISHFVIPRGTSPTEILFEKSRRYKSFRSFLIPFSDNSGPEGDYYGVKGFGDAIYDNCHFNNQFFNHMSRSALMANMPMWMTGSEADRDKVAQIKWTMNGIMNPGITLQQVNMKTDLSGMMGIFSASQRTVNANSRTFPTGETIGQEAKTATQSTFDRQDQSKLSSFQLKFYRMVCLDSLLYEMYRRLSRTDYPSTVPGGRAASSFREKCKEAGIPPEAFSNPIEVKADRAGGTGNQALDLMVAKEVLAVASPGRGQFNARRGIVKALVGSDRVDEYVQGEDYPQEQQGCVNLENSCLADGQTFEATPDQDHQVHLGEMTPEGKGHLGLLIQTFQVAQQMVEAKAVENALEDAKKLERSLEATLTHTAQHVEFLASFGVPAYQEAAKQIEKLLNDVGQFIETFRAQIGVAIQNQQPQGPQLPAEEQAKLMKAQVDIQIKQAFADQQLAANQAKQDQKLGHTAERSAFKNETDRLKFEQDSLQKQEAHNQEMGQQAIQALTEAERAAAETAKTRAEANAKKVQE